MREQDTVKATLVLIAPVELNTEVLLSRREKNAFYAELQECITRAFVSLPWQQVAKMSVEHLKSAKDYAPYAQSKTRSRRDDFSPRGRILKITLQVEAPRDAQVQWAGEKFLMGTEPSYGFAAAEERLMDRVSLVFLASQIAHPGAAHFGVPFIYRDGEPRGVGTKISWVLQEIRYPVKEHGWPPLLRLPIADVDEWLTRIPGVRESMGVDRTGRALAAFSCILCRSPGQGSEMGIVWALLGLEALYAEGNQGLSQQILRKSELVLGTKRANKKRLDGVYNYRSRFLHGDIDMPFAFTDGHMDPPDLGKFMLETYDYWGIATSMLVATLQQMVRLKLIELKFSLSLDKPDSDAAPTGDKLALVR